MGDRSLSDEEIKTIKDWVEGGSPEGNPADAPKPPTFPVGSQLGTPDLVLKMKEAWTVQGNNKDVYRFFVLPTGLLENRDVSAIEFRPGNAKVVHHVLYFQDTSGTARALDAKDPQPGYSGFGDPGFQSASNLLGWVPGAQMRFFPPNIGARLYKNSDLVIQVHYAPSDEEQTDQSSVNIFFQPGSKVRQIQQFTLNPQHLTNGSFIIPANAVKRFTTRYVVPLEISMIAIAPHMHLLGTNCRAYAVTPGNDTINLIKINDWDFHWQGSYGYPNPIRIPRQSTLYYEAEYDNSPNNPHNPNVPPKLVSWGESTTDEMLLCYFFWLPYQLGDEGINMNVAPVTGVDEGGNAAQSILTVGPNPVHGSLTLAYTIPHPGSYTIQIVDATGRVLHQVLPSTTLNEGKYTKTISTQHLSTGTYFLNLIGTDVSLSERIVVF